jgi:hypothetical protein
VADSVPVPFNGNDLKAHLIVNPSGVCPDSQLCLPLPYLGCQVTPSVPARSSRHTFTHKLPPWSHCLVLHLCLPSPPCAYWDPGLLWKTCTMVPYDFLKLLLHLVCHAPWSTPTLNHLQGSGGGKGTHRKLWPHHTHALTPPQQGEEGKQTGALMHRDTSPSHWTPWVQQ